MRRKNKQIQARVTEKEYRKIKAMAAKSGYKTFNEYMTNDTLNKEIIVYDLEDILKRLSVMGGELTKLTMLCHQGKVKAVNFSKYKRELSEILDELGKLKTK